VTKTNVAAVVPRQRDKKGGGGEANGIADRMIDAPLSVYAEAIRRIRLAVEQSLMKADAVVKRPGGAGEVVMVASAVPKEGKTTIALSLARAFALSGRMTLLIDCDLRKPGVHSQLGHEPSDGLLEYLSNDDDTLPLASIVVVDQGSGARIIVGSHRSNVPTDQLLSGVRFQRLLDAARRNFDVIILDTPPLGPVVDGLYLARHADSITFVVRWTSTAQQEVRNSIRALLGAKRPEVEVVTVLNRKEVLRQAYGGRYAGYYSEA
jgi:succinoglycan biosynthesis transport protein ExoP